MPCVPHRTFPENPRADITDKLFLAVIRWGVEGCGGVWRDVEGCGVSSPGTSDMPFLTVLRRALQQTHGVVGGAVPLEPLGAIGAQGGAPASAPPPSAGQELPPSSTQVAASPLSSFPPPAGQRLANLCGLLSPRVGGEGPGASASMVVRIDKRWAAEVWSD